MAGIGRIRAVVLAMDRNGEIMGFGGNQNLASVLAEGTATGANNILVDTGQAVEFTPSSGAATRIQGLGPTTTGITVVNVSSGESVTIRGGMYQAFVAGEAKLTVNPASQLFELASGGAVAWSNSAVSAQAGAKDLRLLRSGVSALVVDDAVGGAATLSVPGAGSASESFGASATTGAGLNALAMGQLASATRNSCTAVGRGAKAEVAISASAFGDAAIASGLSSCAYGQSAASSGEAALSFGASSDAIGAGSVAHGTGAQALHNGALCFGQNATSTAISQLVFGSTTREITNVYIGRGVTAILPQALTFNGTATTTTETDVAGSTLVFASGPGTGAAAVSIINFQTPDARASGALQQLLVTRLTISEAAVIVGFDLEVNGDLNHDGAGVGFYGTTPAAQSAAYTRNAAIVEDRTLLASASATTLNNNNVLAAIVADLQATGLLA